ncbi:uncharacterized protein [Triticum aestivum]|nr:uncharacterized protein LOC123124961 [Triticum aestivum]
MAARCGGPCPSLPALAHIYTPAHAPARCTVLSRPRTASNSSTRLPHALAMSRALALAALLLLAALAAAPLASADSSAESVPFAKEVASGAEAAKNAGTQAASAVAGGATPPVDPDPSSAIKADPAPARR